MEIKYFTNLLTLAITNVLPSKSHVATEKGLKTTSYSKCALNALAIYETLEYTRLHLEKNMQMWVEVKDSLEL